VSHTLAHLHGLSLIELEHKLKFQGKPEYPISQTGWSGFDRFSIHQRRLSVTEIGLTSAQATFERGKARIVANLGASCGGYG
jgi:hypothetical protein